MKNSEIKALAKKQISGNILMYLLVSLIIAAINGAASTVVIGGLLVSPILTMGMALINLDIRDGKGVEITRIFTPFNDFGRTWVAIFLLELYTILWSLLFVIPGIVKGLGYSMTPYILAENPDISATDAIKASSAMMKGHKMELFGLYLSFIGWFLLCVITLGIAVIYVKPYVSLSVVNFYDRIKPAAAKSEYDTAFEF